jgi:hypothetical protein
MNPESILIHSLCLSLLLGYGDGRAGKDTAGSWQIQPGVTGAPAHSTAPLAFGFGCRPHSG